jgi:hypothetical protein
MSILKNLFLEEFIIKRNWNILFFFEMFLSENIILIREPRNTYMYIFFKHFK